MHLPRGMAFFAGASCLFGLAVSGLAADHNDPNAINSIFGDIAANPADLYDLFGFPADNTTGSEKVVIALTFASLPSTEGAPGHCGGPPRSRADEPEDHRGARARRE